MPDNIIPFGWLEWPIRVHWPDGFYAVIKSQCKYTGGPAASSTVTPLNGAQIVYNHSGTTGGGSVVTSSWIVWMPYQTLPTYILGFSAGEVHIPCFGFFPCGAEDGTVSGGFPTAEYAHNHAPGVAPWPDAFYVVNKAMIYSTVPSSLNTDSDFDAFTKDVPLDAGTAAAFAAVLSTKSATSGTEGCPTYTVGAHGCAETITPAPTTTNPATWQADEVSTTGDNEATYKHVTVVKIPHRDRKPDFRLQTHNHNNWTNTVDVFKISKHRVTSGDFPVQPYGDAVDAATLGVVPRTWVGGVHNPVGGKYLTIV